MEIKVLDKKDNTLALHIKNTDDVFINTLRRIIISEVPTLAIKNVKFIKNNSALFDEIIAHRMGLLPLKADLETYNLPEECSCKMRHLLCSGSKAHIPLRDRIRKTADFDNALDGVGDHFFRL